MTLKIETMIERAGEQESRGDVPEDCDYHNYLTLLPRTHRGSDKPVCVQRLFGCCSTEQLKTQPSCGCLFSTDYNMNSKT